MIGICPLIVPFGGGRNGTALLLEMYERGIRPDLILFANTKGEKPDTYIHINEFGTWLVAHDMPPITVVKKTSIYESLEDECRKKKTLPSLAFGWRSCSDKWKQEPQRKYMNNWLPAQLCWATCSTCGIAHGKVPDSVIGHPFTGSKVIRAIGFHAGEAHRAAKFTEDANYRNWYPLIEWGLDNEDCIETIRRHGITVPPKSACYYCPASTKKEVIALKAELPEYYDAAVSMERNAKDTLVKIKGLGRRWSWEDVGSAPEVHTIEQSCICFDE